MGFYHHGAVHTVSTEHRYFAAHTSHFRVGLLRQGSATIIKQSALVKTVIAERGGADEAWRPIKTNAPPIAAHFRPEHLGRGTVVALGHRHLRRPCGEVRETIKDTNVTDARLPELKSALPNCKIKRR